MRISAVIFALLGAVSTLLGQADAAADLFRGDSRGPKIITANKPSGFLARAYGRDTSKQGDLRQHVTNNFKGGVQDAYISTTSDISVAKDFASKTAGKYLYHLDSSKIADKTNVADWYAEQNLKNPYEKEKETAVKLIIPWAAVVKVEREVNGVWKTVKLDGSDSNPKPKPGLSDPDTNPKPKTKPAPETTPKPKTEPVPETKPKPESKPAPVTKPAPKTKPAPVTKPGSKISVPVTKSGSKPGRKGSKRHARDFSPDNEPNVNGDAGEPEATGDADEQIFSDADDINE